MFIENHSRAGTGFVPVIPNYTETQAGIYGIGKYHLARGGVEAGLRLDMQETRASGYDWTGSPYGGTRSLTTCPTAGRPLSTFQTLEAHLQLRSGLACPSRV